MAPEIIELVKLEGGVPYRGPPRAGPYKRAEWLLTLAGCGTVRLTTCQFLSYRQVQHQCVRQLFCMPDTIEQAEWGRLINKAFEKLRPPDPYAGR